MKEQKTARKLTRKQAKILKIYVDSTSNSQLLEKISYRLKVGTKFYIVTPNPEIALMANKDSLLAKIINEAEFSIPDGSGFRLVDPTLTIIHGRKLMLDLLKIANEEKLKVFLLGALPEVNNKAVEILSKGFPHAKIEGTSGPAELDSKGQPVSQVNIAKQFDAIGRINRLQPAILFVAFTSPKTEKWIHMNLPKLNIRCAMVVGGSFNYITKFVSSPPVWMEKLELEWFWRLITQPWRARRIANAILIFPLYVLLSKLGLVKS